MICRKCGKGTRVLDCRPLQEGRVIRRRRECLFCKERVTTYEREEGAPRIDRLALTNAFIAEAQRIADLIEHGAFRG